MRYAVPTLRLAPGGLTIPVAGGDEMFPGA